MIQEILMNLCVALDFLIAIFGILILIKIVKIGDSLFKARAFLRVRFLKLSIISFVLTLSVLQLACVSNHFMGLGPYYFMIEKTAYHIAAFAAFVWLYMVLKPPSE